MFKIVFVLLNLVFFCDNQKIPSNPCPDVFTYRQARGYFYGDIAVPFDGSKHLNLAVNISMVGLYQNVKIKLELLTPAEEILYSTVLHYRVYFPVQNVIPKITQITYNGKVFCYGPSEQLSPNGVTNLWANIIYKINEYTFNVQNGVIQPSSNSFGLNNNQNNVYNLFPDEKTPNPPIQPKVPTLPEKLSDENTCGLSNNIQTLVLHGEKTVENEYPWLVAIFRRQGVSYEFQCTGNLISTRHIITAAHCVWFYNAPLIDKEDILLVLGRSDISHWASTGAVIKTAHDVTPHPSYQQGSGHCDVAIITMNENINFNPTIRPVCLWNDDTNLKFIAGNQGIVAGWGKSEEVRQVVAVPRKISMPVVTQETCLRSHADFKNLTSDMTFCAGNKDGSGPCSGDSGAGFILKKNGRWYLRGLVSTAIRKEDFSCDLNEFIVFSDVAKVKGWIEKAMK